MSIGKYCITVAHEFNNNISNSDSFFSSFNKYKKCFNKNYMSVDYNLYDTIILVDDYSGSGTNIKNTLKHIDELGFKKNVIVIPLFITNVAKEFIINHSIEFPHIHVEFSEISIVRKAKFITVQRIIRTDEEQRFKRFSAEIAFVDEKHIYGFKDTEDLIGFAHFTPNNTLGFLWHNEYCYSPLLISRDNSFYQQRRKKFSHELISKLKELIKIKPGLIDKEKEISLPTLAFFCLCLMLKEKQGVKAILSMDENNYEYYLEVATRKMVIKYIEERKKYIPGRNFKLYFDEKKYEEMLSTGKLPRKDNYIETSLQKLIEE